MESRKIFLAGEIKRLKQLLKLIYDNYPYDNHYDEEKRFKEILNLLLETNEKISKIYYLSKFDDLLINILNLVQKNKSKK